MTRFFFIQEFYDVAAERFVADKKEIESIDPPTGEDGDAEPLWTGGVELLPRFPPVHWRLNNFPFVKRAELGDFPRLASAATRAIRPRRAQVVANLQGVRVHSATWAEKSPE